MDKQIFSALTLLAVGAISEVAHASVVPPGINFSVTSDNGSSTSSHVWSMTGSNANANTANWFTDSDFSSVALPNDKSGTEFEYWNVYDVPSDGFKIETLSDIKADPFVESFFAVKNTLNIPQTFVITTTLSVDSLPTTNYQGGSVAIALIDTNGAGASVTTNGSAPLFTGQLDGVTAFTLYNSPFSLLAGNGASSSTNTTAGLDVNSYPLISSTTGPVFGSIGIRNEFILSPGDIAAFTSYYRVEGLAGLPEPTMLGLGGMAMMLMMRRNRQK